MAASAWVAISPACSADEWPLVAPAASCMRTSAPSSPDESPARHGSVSHEYAMIFLPHRTRSAAPRSEADAGRERRIFEIGAIEHSVISCDGRRWKATGKEVRPL